MESSFRPYAQAFWTGKEDMNVMEEWAQRSTMTATVELVKTPAETFECVELSKEITRWKQVVKHLGARVMDAEGILDDAKCEKKAAEDRLEELMQKLEGQKKRKAVEMDEAKAAVIIPHALPPSKPSDPSSAQ